MTEMSPHPTQHHPRTVFDGIRHTTAACTNAGHGPANHFEEILEMVPVDPGAYRPVDFAVQPPDGEKPWR